MLAIENILVRYGSITALHDISIKVQTGELVALIGANGAGKTTTLTTVAGNLKPVTGDIQFENTSIASLSPEQIIRKGIAIVPEGREIFASLTVEENLKLGAYIRRDRSEFKRDLDETVTMFPILGERIHQQGGTLSGGEQQQLAVARALMSHPKLLMMDEPSLGLAPALVDQIFELIVKLHDSGMTILLVEQNVERTLDIVKRAYLLKNGRVEAEGAPEVIRKHVDIESVYLGSKVN
ncbi:MAG: ABC transporter ATP-binding protein [Anaerolineales bacterium]|nr:ABC transporter ATP-binding protein [Anaerolineales bacterium]